ncbi:hypothetical protein niasHT_015238 [Heterodera trifolii]|uniref:RING-type domain-containing protein n=1 Tax=Heterodera trifolii TaxID=157864 RepID=A0ABD2L2L3_9BILA
MDKNEQTMADLITLNLNEKEKPSTENKIHTWLVNRRLDPISLAKNAWSKFKQYKVTKAINRITEHTVENDGDGGCAICLGAYEIGDKVRTLPCEHQFHSECVDEWIKKHNNCPSCRAQILNVELFRNARPNNGQHEQGQSSRAIENEQQNLDNTENV